MNLKYRPDIDGLRAVCVFSVVFYHAMRSTHCSTQNEKTINWKKMMPKNCKLTKMIILLKLVNPPQKTIYQNFNLWVLYIFQKN